MQDKHVIIAILIICSLLVILFVAFISFILFLHQRKQTAFEKQLATIRNNNEKELLRSQLEMQEQTFQYASREIHDNVGQFISLAKLHLNTLDIDKRDDASERISDASSLLTRALDDLRDLSRSLSSELIRTAGLAKAVQLQVTQLQKAGSYHILFDVKGNCQHLEEQKEIIIFRILQETINNIVRHAAAKEVIVLLSYLANRVILYIRDNGGGFDPGMVSYLDRKNDISGIRNMMKRAKMIDADFRIKSNPGAGTIITVSVPYKS
jgi:two-component system NarL family sensor kinase